MKVYIAAAASEIDRAEHWAIRLRDAGIECSSSWMANVRAVGESNPHSASQRERALYASLCVIDIHDSHLLWLLTPSTGHATRGGWFELGCAHTSGLPCIASGDTAQSIEWANSKRGEWQPRGAGEGCMRHGLCETGAG